MLNWIFSSLKFLLVTLIGVLSISTNAAAQSSSNVSASIDEANRLISKGDCVGAEVQVRNGVPKPIYYTMLGMIQLDCRNNKASAIEYFKLGAIENESVAKDILTQMGVKVERATTSNNNYEPITSYPSSVEPPPPHQFSTLPIQRPRIYVPPPIIVVRPMVSPYACIQDGGATFCPYYRR